MFKKAWNFIKYNNATVLIFLLVFLLGAGAFASETGREIVGGKTTREEGVDNTLLLEADIDNLDMDFSITGVESDGGRYYVKYTYIDLVKGETAWEYKMFEKELAISPGFEGDLGDKITEELSEVRSMRLADLKSAQTAAKDEGEAKRVEVTEYSGLIGKTLDLAGKVIPGYEPVVRREIASPVAPIALRDLRGRDPAGDPVEPSEPGKADSMSAVYEDYVLRNDPDSDNVFGALDNCPGVSNPLQEDEDADGIGDACDGDADGLGDTDGGDGVVDGGEGLDEAGKFVETEKLIEIGESGNLESDSAGSSGEDGSGDESSVIDNAPQTDEPSVEIVEP
jgi:hypothetical protein